jgi:predicted ferric reductase
MRVKTAPFLCALVALSFALVAAELPAGTRISMAAFSLGSGVVALVMMAFASILGARWKAVESVFGGLDRVYETHKWLGVWALVFASVHLVFKAGMPGWDTAAIIDLPSFLVRLVRQLSFVALMVIVLLALNRRIPYRTWRWWHKLSGPLFLVVVLHWLSFKTPIVLVSPAGLWLAGASVLGLLAALYKLFMYPLLSRHAEYRVVSVLPGPSAVKLSMAPVGNGIPFKAGQFAFLSFNESGLLEPHPFTIASAGGAGQPVQFVIRALGDYTTRLVAEVSTGMTVVVHAPFGRFARPAQAVREVWVAGGVGISPFIAWLDDDEAGAFERVTLFNFQTPGRAFPAPEVVGAAARRRGAHYVPMLVGAKAPAFQDRFAQLAHEAGGGGLQVCFCGPSGLLDEVRAAMARHGVPEANLRFELFDFR